MNRRGTAFSGFFTDASKIAGRVCPANVYVDSANPLANSRCLYYDLGHSIQSLDAASCANCQISGKEAEDWLKGWDGPATEGGSGSSYFEGKIRTCAAIGMRLPVLYETQARNPGNYLPSQDLKGNKPIYMVDEVSNADILKFYSFLPPIKVAEYSYTWTATASRADINKNSYFVFDGTTVVYPASVYYNSTSPYAAVRCVLPSH